MPLQSIRTAPSHPGLGSCDLSGSRANCPFAWWNRVAQSRAHTCSPASCMPSSISSPWVAHASLLSLRPPSPFLACSVVLSVFCILLTLLSHFTKTKKISLCAVLGHNSPPTSTRGPWDRRVSQEAGWGVSCPGV